MKIDLDFDTARTITIENMLIANGIRTFPEPTEVSAKKSTLQVIDVPEQAAIAIGKNVRYVNSQLNDPRGYVLLHIEP